MPTFFVQNFGCRATQADADAIERQLLSRGYGRSTSQKLADVVVLNTCTVTASADRQARDAIRQRHRANPSGRVVVTGCYAQRAPEELAVLEGVTWVVGNSHQTEIPDLVEKMFTPSSLISSDFVPLARLEDEPLSLASAPAKILTGDIFESMSVPVGVIEGGEGHRTRPILKIQDGCNNRCAYCVIPFVRGRSRSMPADLIIAEVRRLVRAGAKEIVLSGINLGSYGRDLRPPMNLQEIGQRIIDETPLERLRFSSIEPQDITQDFVGFVATSKRVACHFHIPLQSGSDRILRAMRRWYRATHYARRVQLIYDLLPDAAIGADIIAGFPGETEEDFRATCEFVAALPLTYLHVFAFSGRPGTLAENLPEQVPLPTIRERARKLRALAAEKAASFRASQTGRAVRALTLHRRGQGWTEALTGNYLKVRVAGNLSANQWFDVCLSADPQEVLAATPTESASSSSSSVFENHFSKGQIAAMGD